MEKPLQQRSVTFDRYCLLFCYKLLLVTVEGDTNQSLVSSGSAATLTILFRNSFEGECLLIELV